MINKEQFEQELLAWKAKIAEIDDSRKAIISKLNYVGQSVDEDARLHEISLAYLDRIYTITFDPNTGTCSTKTLKVPEKRAIGSFPVATKESSRFNGWFTSKTGGTQYNLTDIVTSDLSAYAQWTLMHTFTFDPTSGTCNEASRDVEDGKVVGTLPSASKDNAKFLGWFSSASKDAYQYDASYIVNIDLTAYAQYVALYTITFNANGGTCSETSRVKEDGQTIGVLPTATKTKSEFQGWYSALTGGSKYESSHEVTSDLTAYAHYIALHTLTFNASANGGTCAEISRSVKDGIAIGELPTASKSSSLFLGWYTASSGGTQYTASSTLTADATAYAQFRTSYTVTFDTDGGSAVDSIQVVAGSKIGTLPTSTKDDYQLVGWFSSRTSSTQYNSETVINSNMTFYAQWISEVFYFETIGTPLKTTGEALGAGFEDYADDVILGDFKDVQSGTGTAGDSTFQSIDNFNFADAIELVFLVRTGTDVTSNQEIFTGCSVDHDEFGVVSKKFMWEVASGGTTAPGTIAALPSTWYWVKVVKAAGANKFSCYVSDPNGDESTYTLDYTGSRSSTVNSKIALGVDGATGSGEQWRGYINLSKSYFIVNGTKIRLAIKE